jgi:hypothetical protein
MAAIHDHARGLCRRLQAQKDGDDWIDLLVQYAKRSYV